MSKLREFSCATPSWVRRFCSMPFSLAWQRTTTCTGARIRRLFFFRCVYVMIAYDADERKAVQKQVLRQTLALGAVVALELAALAASFDGNMALRGRFLLLSALPAALLLFFALRDLPPEGDFPRRKL